MRKRGNRGGTDLLFKNRQFGFWKESGVWKKEGKPVANQKKEHLQLKPIAVIHTDFSEKFGIPRQSGLAAARGRIVFEPEYRNPDALKGIEAYSHLWLIWGFSLVPEKEWQPTVRPPRLGGNRRMGVFATRSPFRPNPIGLSLVELIASEQRKDVGTTLLVEGVDMLDKTPIYDIKPYLPHLEGKPDAAGGFAEQPCGSDSEGMGGTNSLKPERSDSGIVKAGSQTCIPGRPGADLRNEVWRTGN